MDRDDLEQLARDIGAELRRRNLRLSEEQEARLHEHEHQLLTRFTGLRADVERPQAAQLAEAQAVWYAERAAALAKEETPPEPTPEERLWLRIKDIMRRRPWNAETCHVTLQLDAHGNINYSHDQWTKKEPRENPRGREVEINWDEEISDAAEQLEYSGQPGDRFARG